jgi:tRNA (guanine-N7-)-methyltransferase
MPNLRDNKSYVIRSSRITAWQLRCYEELFPQYGVYPSKENPISSKAIFGDDRPLVVEIGFGMGAATIEIAEAFPDRNFIGIDVHKPGIGKLLGEIDARKTKNLRLIEGDALVVLEEFTPPDSLYGINLFFPDPWPKKRHHKRRILQVESAQLFAEKLIPGGYLYMVTDWLEYAEFSLAILEKNQNLKNTAQGFSEPQAWRPLTKFEKRGISQERPSSELYFIKA